ncbi:HAD-IIB family hydrolase [Fluviibacterium sp. DFM31]|uniref:HAD-IIB family hydrolase n=1 Tax=Meridianimarinicoccus marinus TaxID=3231483 RepID=A0ABV3L5R1_9RHOB
MTQGAEQMDRPWCLISDIDDTLTGDDAALERLGQVLAAYRDRVKFAVNSSRPLASVRQTLAEVFPSSMIPDATITAMGTEITVAGAPLASWSARFEGWPQARVFEILAGLGHRPHAPEFQTPLKVSFAVPVAAQDAAQEALEGLPCQIIASGRDDFDVLPEGAGKGAATLHLAQALGCDPDRVIVAGDSGNDVAMFQAVGQGIAVANARQELLRALTPGTFFHASAPHAGGVLEGLKRYGAIPDTV